jgi:hypothetical protein
MTQSIRRKTNTEFVAELMEFSEFGAMSQLFIVNAIQSAAESVASTDPTTLDDSGPISPTAWIGVAKEILVKFDKQYGADVVVS